VPSSSDCSSYSFSDGSAKGQGKPTPKRLTKTEKGDISERLGKNNQFREILTGMQLGDSCIHKDKSRPNTDARLHISLKDKSFTLELWQYFDSLGIVGATPRECSCFLKETCRAVPLSGPAPGQTDSSYQFASFTLPFFSELRQKWYKEEDGKKREGSPFNIAELLTPRALAYWLASDCTFEKTQGE
jgi:hypothetical protein